ncbi:MAG: phage holin family protein [Patescibacteria group bacterium]
MFSLIKTLIAAAAAIFTVSFFIPGISYQEDLQVFLAATLIFALFQMLVKPVLNLVALPLNFVTFGLFSFLISVGLFYLVSSFVPGFTIAGFSFPGIHFGALLIPAFEMPVYGTAILGAFVSSLIFSVFGQSNG